mmetsp:Transcript_33387/g.59165  ORF Transcript_33387/g.59165 Transcript_33387/m.59165 type:complete len:191 (-) Transcript_33387:5-577(-)
MSSSYSSPMKVVVASTAVMKVAAVQKLFATAQVEGVKAASGVRDQPFGHEETIQGALNRLEDAKLQAPAADLYISMENGLFEVCTRPDHVMGFDLAWVAIEDSAGRRSLAHSAGVEMPAAAVAVAKESNFSRTAGSQVAHSANCTRTSDLVDPQDPHKYLTNGDCSREELLLSALSVAWGQLQLKVEAGQ